MNYNDRVKITQRAITTYERYFERLAERDPKFSGKVTVKEHGKHDHYYSGTYFETVTRYDDLDKDYVIYGASWYDWVRGSFNAAVYRVNRDDLGKPDENGEPRDPFNLWDTIHDYQVTLVRFANLDGDRAYSTPVDAARAAMRMLGHCVQNVDECDQFIDNVLKDVDAIGDQLSAVQRMIDGAFRNGAVHSPALAEAWATVDDALNAIYHPAHVGECAERALGSLL